MRHLLFPAAILALCASALCADEPKPVELHGYFKNYFSVFARSLPGSPLLGADSNRFRLNASQEITGGLWHLSYTLNPRIQAPALFVFDPSVAALGDLSSSYRVVDLAPALYGPEGNLAFYQNLDRAYVKEAARGFDLYVGRQAVAWGTAKVINPTDVVAPFRFDELDREERVGVDAVRLRVPTGELSEIDTGYVAGRDFLPQNSAFWAREKWYVLGADVSASLIDFRQNLLAGIDAARSVGGAGAWFEAAYVFAGLFGSNQRDDYLRGSLGADYNFNDRAYGYLEYHYNGAGADNPADYLSLRSHTAFILGTDFLVGTQYLTPGLTYQLTPLLSLGGQSIFNLLDGSAFVSGQVEYNILQNAYLSLGVLLGAGRPADYSPLGGLSRMNSEFGAYDDLYYSQLRVYY
jgi:hypothetical protein